MSRTTNLFKVLGVAEASTSAEVKTAYRKLAKEWHPDVNNSPHAGERFRSITAAYDVLKDDNKRSFHLAELRGFDSSFYGTSPGARPGDTSSDFTYSNFHDDQKSKGGLCF
jgi:molecular chaperone DnaJ